MFRFGSRSNLSEPKMDTLAHWYIPPGFYLENDVSVSPLGFMPTGTTEIYSPWVGPSKVLDWPLKG